MSRLQDGSIKQSSAEIDLLEMGLVVFSINLFATNIQLHALWSIVRLNLLFSFLPLLESQ